jgi:hypothetical protein
MTFTFLPYVCDLTFFTPFFFLSSLCFFPIMSPSLCFFFSLSEKHGACEVNPNVSRSHFFCDSFLSFVFLCGFVCVALWICCSRSL